MENYSNKMPLTLGRGKIFLSQDGEHFEYMGNTSSFNVNIASEKLEHESLEQSVKFVDKTVITKMTASGQIVADNTTNRNIAKFVLGTTQKVNTEVKNVEKEQTLGSYEYVFLDKFIDEFTCKKYTDTLEFTVKEDGVATEKITVALFATATVGVYKIVCSVVETVKTFKIYDENDVEITPNTICTVTDVNASDGDDFILTITRQEVVYTNYDLSKLQGSFCVRDAGEFVLSYTTQAKEYTEVLPGASSNMYFHIRFLGDPATGTRQNLSGYCMINPNGDLGFKSDDWEKLTFDLSFNRHELYNSELGFIYEDLGEVD